MYFKIICEWDRVRAVACVVMGKNDSREYLRGVHFRLVEGELYAVGTDAHILLRARLRDWSLREGDAFPDHGIVVPLALLPTRHRRDARFVLEYRDGNVSTGLLDRHGSLVADAYEGSVNSGAIRDLFVPGLAEGMAQG